MTLRTSDSGVFTIRLELWTSCLSPGWLMDGTRLPYHQGITVSTRDQFHLPNGNRELAYPRAGTEQIFKKCLRHEWSHMNPAWNILSSSFCLTMDSFLNFPSPNSFLNGRKYRQAFLMVKRKEIWQGTKEASTMTTHSDSHWLSQMCQVLCPMLGIV